MRLGSQSQQQIPFCQHFFLEGVLFARLNIAALNRHTTFDLFVLLDRDFHLLLIL
jgi:hypothetical protein